MADSQPPERPQERAYLSFDGMCWPNPNDPREVAWKLIHGQPTREELLIAVSFISAYQQLASDSQRVRNSKVSRIRRALASARKEINADG